jgi:two-component system, cell cycle response regulator DivK
VLIVEDDLDSREMYAKWLAHSGFRVAQARTGEEAFTKAQDLFPDLITVDIGLRGGGIDGCELCEQLKKHERTQAIPVIAVTAWAMAPDVIRARKAGCASVLTKPCSPDTLLSEIQRLLSLPSTRASVVADQVRGRSANCQ